MEQSRSIGTFLRDPIARWVVTSPTTLAFCALPDLCGGVAWGRPSSEDVERLLEAFAAIHHPKVAPRFDVLLDSREIDGIDPDGLAVLMAWLRQHRAELRARVRVQIGVIADTLPAVTLAGILPVMGETHDFRMVRDPRDAFRALSSDGDTLWREIEAAVAAARGASPELRELRALLRGAPAGMPIDVAARALAVSPRTLQRLLRESGTTFRGEVRNARFAVAQELLVHGDDKIAVVARRVGLSENSLVTLVREKTGRAPAELRRQHR